MFIIDKEKYPVNKKYIIGVSGGPDSMCLLSFLLREGYHLIVCNVNYNTRDVSSKEQEMVKAFCKENNAIFEGLSVQKTHLNENFEGWAREKRYLFFHDNYKKYHADGIFIAHHKNDDLETYILQKNRNNIVRYWGLAENSFVLGMKVIRPFLKYTKKELIDYCHENNIPYSIDVTNLQPVCNRNKIRIDIMEKYTSEQIENLFLEKEKDNQKLELQMSKISPLLLRSEWEIKELDSLSEIEQVRFIYCLITKQLPSLANKMPRKRIEDYLKCIHSSKPNVEVNIAGDYYLCKSYNLFSLVNKTKNNFVYILESPGKLDTKEFSLDFPKDTAFMKIYEDSYPLTIRNAKPDDIVTFGKVAKRVNRIMIDEKIPLYRRKSYPIVVDKNGKIVYFPLYNSDKQKNIASKLSFVIK